MKAVLISIQPKWCNKILSGAKTLEVRKTKPDGVKLGKLDEAFKCYIYCTGVKKLPLAEYVEIHRATGGAVDDWHGKVIAEFVCDGIYPVCYTMDGFADAVDCNCSLLKPSDFITYGKGKPLYGWSITELKVYDNPKELSEFCEWKKPITRPPQSWCYVEEEK